MAKFKPNQRKELDIDQVRAKPSLQKKTHAALFATRSPKQCMAHSLLSVLQLNGMQLVATSSRPRRSLRRN